LSKRVTMLRRQARRAPLPSTWWAELTIDFVDQLQRTRPKDQLKFFDRLMRATKITVNFVVDPEGPQRLKATLDNLAAQEAAAVREIAMLQEDRERRRTDQAFPGSRGRGARQPLPEVDITHREQELEEHRPALAHAPTG